MARQAVSQSGIGTQPHLAHCGGSRVGSIQNCAIAETRISAAFEWLMRRRGVWDASVCLSAGNGAVLVGVMAAAFRRRVDRGVAFVSAAIADPAEERAGEQHEAQEQTDLTLKHANQSEGLGQARPVGNPQPDAMQRYLGGNVWLSSRFAVTNAAASGGLATTLWFSSGSESWSYSSAATTSPVEKSRHSVYR